MGPIREMLQASNISEQQWRVLRVVEEAGEIEQSAIAQSACLLLPSLTRIVRTLADQGLLCRRTDKTDRRRTLVSITDKGKAVIEAHVDRNAEIFGALEAQFGADRLDALLDLLEDLRKTRI